MELIVLVNLNVAATHPLAGAGQAIQFSMAIAGNAATALLKRTTRPCTASSSARHNSGRRALRSRRRSAERRSDRQIRASRIDAEARTPYIYTTQGALAQLGARAGGWAHSSLFGERLGSTGFDLGALVGGFLDVHAIIRLEGAASSWYPVYDRVLPACAERSAAAPLGAALHSPNDRRVRASAAHPPPRPLGASGGACARAVRRWRRTERMQHCCRGGGADAQVMIVAHAEPLPSARADGVRLPLSMRRGGAEWFDEVRGGILRARAARRTTGARGFHLTRALPPSALTPGPFSLYALAWYARRAALASLHLGSQRTRVRTQISLGRTAVIVSDVWSLYWCRRRSHRSWLLF